MGVKSMRVMRPWESADVEVRGRGDGWGRAISRSALDGAMLLGIVLAFLAGGCGIVAQVGGVTITAHHAAQPLMVTSLLWILKAAWFPEYRDGWVAWVRRAIERATGFHAVWIFLELVVWGLAAMSIVRYPEELWDLDYETSYGTTFSALLMTAIGLAAIMNGWMERTLCRTDHRPWFGVGAIFLYLGWDEIARFHETFRDFVTPAVKGLGPWGEAYIHDLGWQGVYGPFLAFAGCFLLWALWRKFGRSGKSLLVVAAFFSYGTAIILDALLVVSPDFWGMYRWEVAVEEGLEMSASVGFLTAFLAYFRGLPNCACVKAHREPRVGG